MSSINAISSEKLARLIGTPRAPVLIDVRTDEDFAADPRFIPASIRRDHRSVSRWGNAHVGRSAIVICQCGAKLSQGTAGWLRHKGVPADILEGGYEAWTQSGGALVAENKLPPRDEDGRTIWVTRARPKVDRIACPWLIRRFVDPTAVFLFVASAEVTAVAERFGGAAFDIENTFWSHRGDTCTFDTMIEEFGLDHDPLKRLAFIVRGADTGRRTSLHLALVRPGRCGIGQRGVFWLGRLIATRRVVVIRVVHGDFFGRRAAVQRIKILAHRAARILMIRHSRELALDT